MDKIRILIVDDNASFRDGLRTMLHYTPEAMVAGEAAQGSEAISKALALQPDVVLMDIQMTRPGQPGINGIEATQKIKAQLPTTAVIKFVKMGEKIRKLLG